MVDNRVCPAVVGGGELLFRLKKISPYLGNYVEKLIETRWSDLWMGDQIPETVEHSGQHSKRIMEIAGNVMRSLDIGKPLGEGKSKHLYMDRPIPLALLISAIYLHDIGHTALTYPVDLKSENGDVFPLALFPSAVREVHNLLSAEMVRERAEDLFPDPVELEGFEAEEDSSHELRDCLEILKNLVPEICAGHRGYVRLDDHIPAKKKKSVWAVGKFLMGKEGFKSTLIPVASRLDRFADIFDSNSVSKGEVLTVTALLRIFDGFDIQADRVVGEGHLNRRMDITAYESRALQSQLPLYSEVLKGILCELDGEAISMWSCIKELCGLAESMTPESVDRIGRLCKAIYPAMFDHMRKLKGDKGFQILFDRENLLTVHALSLVNRIAFKWEQIIGSYGYLSIEAVCPVPSEMDLCSVDIKLIPKTPPHCERPDAVADELASIVVGMNREIERVGKHLNGVIFRPVFSPKAEESQDRGSQALKM